MAGARAFRASWAQLLPVVKEVAGDGLAGLYVDFLPRCSFLPSTTLGLCLHIYCRMTIDPPIIAKSPYSAFPLPSSSKEHLSAARSKSY